MDRYKSENETYREMLQIQEEHPTFEMEAASVIARDSSSRFYSFKIDRGSDQGIALQDPVITQAGMVGIISEVGPNYAVVTTLLDPAFKVGATATASRDPGMVEGDVGLAQEGKTKLRYLAPTSEVKDLMISIPSYVLFAATPPGRSICFPTCRSNNSETD